MRSRTWTFPQPPSHQEPGMDLDTSDSESENMDTHHERRSPYPPLMPPFPCDQEEELQSINLASKCKNLFADIENIINNIDDYYFINDNEKNQYASKLFCLFIEETELCYNLKRTEDDHYSACIGKMNERHGVFKNNDTPFTPVKVETFNKHGNLTIDDPPAHRNEGNENVIQPQPPKTPEAPRFCLPSPIIIDNIVNSVIFLKNLQTITKEDFMGRVISKGLRVYPKTPQAYHTIRNYIDKEKLEVYTYQLSEEKELKAVIRSMPFDMPPQQIVNALLELGITVNDCHVMTNRKTDLPIPLFLISLPKNDANRDVYNIMELCYMNIIQGPL
ncbi:nucleic-acid-binding protein from transposon X-element [Trichonephila clavipes]|nr:nucleic-acid-binding protein from transposon X-element [Trichonephila clavipes]